MHSLALPESVWKALFAEARRTWPREACGVVIGPSAGQPRHAVETARFVPFENLQDALHEQDPDRYPRDARTAYAMNPLKLQRRVDQAEADGETLLAIVHSHPQHPAYFSATDRAAAAPFGMPSYPDAVQLVVSVVEGEVCEVKGFTWDGEDWVDTALDGHRPLPGVPEGFAVYDGEV